MDNGGISVGLGKTGMVILGVVLAVMALAATAADPWLRWLDFTIALASIAAMFVLAERSLRYSPFVMGGALLVLGIIALAAGGASWLPWATLLFGAVYEVFGIAGYNEHPFEHAARTSPHAV
jgi:hypothetical protein